jgi:hypothetical protein
MAEVFKLITKRMNRHAVDDTHGFFPPGQSVGLFVANRLSARQPHRAWNILVCTQDNIVFHTIQTMPDLVDVGNIDMFAAMEREARA